MPSFSIVASNLSSKESIKYYKKIDSYFKKNNIHYPNTIESFNLFIKKPDLAKKELKLILDFFEKEVLGISFYYFYAKKKYDFFMVHEYHETLELTKANNKFSILKSIQKHQPELYEETAWNHLIFAEELMDDFENALFSTIKTSKNKENSSDFLIQNFKLGLPEQSDTVIPYISSIGINVFPTKLTHEHFYYNEIERTSFLTTAYDTEITNYQKKLESQEKMYENTIKTLKDSLQKVKSENKQSKQPTSKDIQKLHTKIDSLENHLNKKDDELINSLNQFNDLDLLAKKLQKDLTNLEIMYKKSEQNNEELRLQLKKSTATNSLLKQDFINSANEEEGKEVVFQEANQEAFIKNEPLSSFRENTNNDTGGSTKNNQFSTPTDSLFHKFISHSLDFLLAEKDNLPSSIVEKLSVGSSNPESTSDFEDSINSPVSEHKENKISTPVIVDARFNKIGPVTLEKNIVYLHNREVTNIPAQMILSEKQIVQVDENFNFIQAFSCSEENNYNSLTRYCYIKNQKVFNASNKEIEITGLKQATHLIDGQVLVISNKDEFLGFCKRNHSNLESCLSSAFKNGYVGYVFKKNNDQPYFIDIQTNQKTNKVFTNHANIELDHNSLVLVFENNIEKVINSKYSFRISSFYNNQQLATVIDESFDTFYAETQCGNIVQINFEFHLDKNPRFLLELGDVIKLDEDYNFLSKYFNYSEEKTSVSNKLTTNKKKSKNNQIEDVPEIIQKMLLVGNVRYKNNYITQMRYLGIETVVIDGYDNFFSIKKEGEKSNIIVVDPSHISHNNMFAIKDEYMDSEKKILFPNKNGANYISQLLKENSII